jgi:hypothetical protein
MFVVITILAGGWAVNRHLKVNDLERANRDLHRQQAELLSALEKARQANRSERHLDRDGGGERLRWCPGCVGRHPAGSRCRRLRLGTSRGDRPLARTPRRAPAFRLPGDACPRQP